MTVPDAWAGVGVKKVFLWEAKVCVGEAKNELHDEESVLQD